MRAKHCSYIVTALFLSLFICSKIGNANPDDYVKQVCTYSNSNCEIFIIDVNKLEYNFIRQIEKTNKDIIRKSYIYVLYNDINFQRKTYWNDAVEYIYTVMISPLKIDSCTLIELSGDKFIMITPDEFIEYLLIITPGHNSDTQCKKLEIEFKKTKL